MVSRDDAHRATGNSEHGGTGMAKIDESKLGDDFSYIFRIAESDIDGLSPISIGLTSIKGIGLRTSQQICRLSGIDTKKLGGLLTDEEKKPTGCPSKMSMKSQIMHMLYHHSRAPVSTSLILVIFVSLSITLGYNFKIIQ